MLECTARLEKKNFGLHEDFLLKPMLTSALPNLFFQHSYISIF